MRNKPQQTLSGCAKIRSCRRSRSVFCLLAPLQLDMSSSSQTRTILAKYVRECGQASRLSSTVRSTCTTYARQILTRRVVVTFDESSSQGQVAMVIYEWKDVKYLGVTTSTTDDSLPVSNPLQHNLSPNSAIIPPAEDLRMHNRRSQSWPLCI